MIRRVNSGSATTCRPKRCYQTQYTDPTTGDVNMAARWYSPTSATFRSRDTWSGDLNTPVTLNRYTYANNNPTRYWDPTGRNGCRTNSDICDGKVVDSQGNFVPTGSKAGSFNTDVAAGGQYEGNGNAHCVGKSDCRPMVSTDQRTEPASVSAEFALYEQLATDGTMQRFVDEGFSPQRLQHVLDARFFSELSDNGLMGFDAQLAHFSDQAPTEREALYRTLNNWDEQWVPGSYWFEGCQTSLNAASNTGWDYCSPDARMAAGGLLLGVAGGFSVAAQTSRLSQSISIADDMGFGVQTATASSTDDLARAAAAPGKGDFTVAGHALTKHGTGQRLGSSAFPPLSGNPTNINRITQAEIDNILATGRTVTRTHPNHGPIIEVFAPDGRGARWYADGDFFGFLEP